jgi:prepilin-type N-terminal cleavage/methylation domain-containing protein
MNVKIKTGAGFTLVELLVVIGVVGVLASVLLTVLNPIEQFRKARDSERRDTLKQLKNILEQYYNDNGAYPSTGGVWYSSETGDLAVNGSLNDGNWIPGLVSKGYIPKLPKDPRGGASTIAIPGYYSANACSASGWKRAYLYRSSNGSEYKLLAHCSAETKDVYGDTDDGLYDPRRPKHAWKVCEGSSACANSSCPTLNDSGATPDASCGW